VTVANGSDDGVSPAPVQMATGAPTHAAAYLAEARVILDQLDVDAVEAVVDRLVRVRESGGRLFFVGSGGGAGHASHAVNDFRKLAGFEAYTPSDNVSELTARVNDEGWEGAYAEWLRTSRFGADDLLFVLSVGGGDSERNISPNLVRCLDLAREVGAGICGVVGRDGGYTARVADACVVVPVVNPATITAHTEAFQAVVWHLLVSHPALQTNATKWESVA
jgi:D-sedoheptulose 7-phosphate isomerase